MTAKEKPRQTADQDRGREKEIIKIIKPGSVNQELEQHAAELAAILIDLYRQYPLFFFEPPADDPDIDMESGFASFGKREIVI